jgi:NADH-quinone oxidoreductase subunit F/NADP-reducing hydrogenase subunit HndC
MTEKRFRIYLCAGLHCTPAGRATLQRTLEHALWQYGLDQEVELRSSSCLNRCAFAPNLTIWPGPFRYAQLTPADITRIVIEHLRDGYAIEELIWHEPASSSPRHQGSDQ